MADLEEVTEQTTQQFKAKYQIRGDASSGKPRILGKGAYGVVYKARCVSTGMMVALKTVTFDSEEEGVPDSAIREVAVLRKLLSHQNVVELLDVHCTSKKMVMAFEFLETDLNKHMKSLGRPLEPNAIRALCYQLNQGIDHLHASGVIHRDLKPQNLLITGTRPIVLKIADLGLARAYTLPIQAYTPEVCTLWYRPPEILLGSQLYSVPVDMWGVGCILAEMATGSPLFCGDSEIDTIFKIFQKLGTPTAEQWPEVGGLPDFKPTFPNWKHKGWENIRNTKAQIGSVGIDLLERLMAFDPKKRMSARRALQHSYFVDGGALETGL